MAPTTLSERIRIARIAHDMTQQELAIALGVSRPAVTMWETAKQQPGTSHLLELPRALGASSEWLLFGRGEKGFRVRRMKKDVDKAS